MTKFESKLANGLCFWEESIRAGSCRPPS